MFCAAKKMLLKCPSSRSFVINFSRKKKLLQTKLTLSQIYSQITHENLKLPRQENVFQVIKSLSKIRAFLIHIPFTLN